MKVKKFYDKEEGFEIPVDENSEYMITRSFCGIPDATVTVFTTYENLMKLSDKGYIIRKDVQEITPTDIKRVATKHKVDPRYLYIISEIFDAISPEISKAVVNDLANGE